MSHYRDNQQAAMARAAALDAELQKMRVEKLQDAARIAALEGELTRLRQYLAMLPQSPYAMATTSNAGTVLVLGILSVVLCQLLGPFAWYYGNQELFRIDQGLSDPRRRGEAVAGRVLGIIGTIFLSLIGFGFSMSILGAAMDL